MAGNAKQKQKLLVLMDILFQYTDEEHPLSAAELVEQLQRHDISAERKSIYSDLEILREYGMDIVQTRTPKNGYFLASRDFELAEVRLLMDAVQSAGFITAKKTRELLRKLEGLTSTYQAQEIGKQVYVDSRVKHGNEEIYYNIDQIHTAITQKRKISFFYCRRRFQEGKIVTVDKHLTISPYALLWAQDHYYLIGNNEKYDNLIHLRVDRMRKVTELEESIRPFEQVCEYKGHFDVADYSRKIFNAFGGQNELVRLRCRNTFAEEILDRLGEDIRILESDETHFTVAIRVAVSEGFLSNILSYADEVEILSPSVLREKYIHKVKKILEMISMIK